MPFTPRIAEDAIGEFDGLRIWDRNPGTGEIRLDIELDFENRRTYSLYEEAWADNGKSSRMSAVVTDSLTGITFRVKRAACGSGCFCAAEVVEVIDNPIADKRDAERKKEYAKRDAEWKATLAKIKAREAREKRKARA